MRSGPSALAAVTALVLLLRLAWQAGGYFAPSYLGVGAIAFAVLGVLLILRPPHYMISTQTLLAVGCLAGLAVWTGLSTRWSIAPDTALAELQLDLVYVGLFGLALVAAGSGRFARHLVWLVLGGAVAIVGAGLLSRLYPDLIATRFVPETLGGYRLAYPFTYWNAYGALAAMTTVLAGGCAADPRTAPPLRALAGGAAVLSAVAMYLSFSRGAWLALIVGLVVLTALAANRGSFLLTAAVVATGSALAIVSLRGYPALTDNPSTRPGQLVSGHDYAGTLIAIVVAVVVVQGIIAFARSSPALTAVAERARRPAVRGVAVGLALALIAIYVVKTAAVEGRTAAVTASASGWVDRQWADFLRPAAISSSSSARLVTSRGTRSDLYRVAIDGFKAHPLLGDGGGGFEKRWARERRVNETVRNAHSLYLETLGDLGLVGALLLLGFVGSILAAAIRARLHPGALGRSHVAAVGGACAVWISHCIVDWDWQVPALTGMALLLAATLFPYGRREVSAAATQPTGERGSPWYLERPDFPARRQWRE